MFGIELKNRLTRIVAIATVVVSILHVNGYNETENELIYILVWTPNNTKMLYFPGMGKIAFKNCYFKNCFLTDNREFLTNVSSYDVIMFNVVDLEAERNLPASRSPQQKYCMYGREAAMIHPIPEEYDGFFNITFTYKLSSNITLPYVIVKNEYGDVVGPKINMQWLEMDNIRGVSEYIKTKLENKQMAAAWIVSSCESQSRGAVLYAENLKRELAHFGHRLDIFGRCGTLKCPNGNFGRCGKTQCPEFETIDECLALIESDYYFYLAFENLSSEDYVTDKLLRGLQHFSVPVVFGNDYYRRFMPDKIYMDANVLAPSEMASKINKIINDNNKYYDFLKWHDYYSYHFYSEDQPGKEFCDLCDFLNNNQNKTSILANITDWWNEPLLSWPNQTLNSNGTVNGETGIDVFANISELYA